ncbi:hypothetical protein C8J56DRAFT_1007727 [Mycena floridula]|nr:hypothetical protein C8J56DRAFT_1007727 [Mycena floridula]
MRQALASWLGQREDLSIRCSASSLSPSTVSSLSTPKFSSKSTLASSTRRFLTTLGHTTLLMLLVGGGWFIWTTQQDKHPEKQLPFEEGKKTLVVLGSGWGATSLLKTLATEDYNVIVSSLKNFFLFTPLLPSVAVGTLSPRFVLFLIPFIFPQSSFSFVAFWAPSSLVNSIGSTSTTTIPYDYLVYTVGAEVQTFGIKGVQGNACFMKEIADAEKMQRRFMDCLETSEDEIDRLLHMVVVGGGPTGVELSRKIHDFLENNLKSWYPELASRIRITSVEALPSVLPTFSKQLIDYTELTFKESRIEVLTGTMVKEVKPDSVLLQRPSGALDEVPCGMVAQQVRELDDVTFTNRRGIRVDDYLRMVGTANKKRRQQRHLSPPAIGDCTATSYVLTAEVASQQGAYLGRLLKGIARKEALEARANSDETDRMLTSSWRRWVFAFVSLAFSSSFISSWSSLKAIADLPFMNGNIASGGVLIYLFWRSAYLSTLFLLRNRTLVMNDWLITKVLGGGGGGINLKRGNPSAWYHASSLVDNGS